MTPATAGLRGSRNPPSDTGFAGLGPAHNLTGELLEPPVRPSRTTHHAAAGEAVPLAVVAAEQTARSWSLPVQDGAYSGIVAWRSAASWLALVRRELTSTRGEKQRALMKISADTLLLVAKDDAASADRLTGRGVSTSHETVAKRLGMSARTVGTARRLLEKLGLAVTVVMGRHLSPAERRNAKRVHGGYQEGAASVRALTIPSRTVPVENFHLPRSGSVLEESPVQRWSPTRAGARANAAPRRKPKKSTNPSRREREMPRPLALQRFAWHVARNYGLDSGASPTAPGALHGGRHLGRLCDILTRYGITPDRYTLDTLRIELDNALAAAKITPLANDQKRDRVAHFAWMLSKLQQATPGETRLERQIREQTQRVRTRQAQLAQAAAAEAQTAAEQEAAEHARNAFLNQFHATRRPSPAMTHRNRTTERVRLVTTLLGAGAALPERSAEAQILIGAVTKVQDELLELGWTTNHQPATGQAQWCDPHTAAIITIHLEGDGVDLMTAGHLSPAARSVLQQLPHPSTT